MKKIIAISITIFFIVSLIIIISSCVNYTRIDSWLERAKDAGNPQQVSEFLQNYKDKLYANALVEGKNSSWFRYPGNDMLVYIRTVDGIIQRAGELAKQAPTDTAYQMGLLNLEKDLGDMRYQAFTVWSANAGMFWWISMWSALLILFVLGIISMAEMM